ncbi:AraC family transcriptional regulator [Nocardia sp. NPDC058518]|uniref:AraC family transcriptional regulator n=1 Tax=Nocardia sp. NPDC058518 TaxID=3346534 RepID=UPI0036650C1A
MTEFAGEFGVSVEQCLGGTGLQPQQLWDPTVEVTARQDLAVSRNLLALLSDRPMHPGLEVGLRYHLTTHGIWGFALVSSPTIREAIDVGLRFFDLTFSLGTVRAREAPDGDLQLLLDAPDVPRPLRRFFVERDVAAILTIQREVLPRPLTARRIEFAFPSPADGVSRYREILGVVPVFDAPETVIVVDAEVMDLPLPQSNPHTMTMAVAQCRELLTRRRGRTGCAGRVRDLLLTEIAAPPDADRVAEAMNMSGRTLRKRLAAEGTSYRTLLDEVREHLAEELLITARLPVEQIAHRLGYVEVSSFSQAFRRWKGVGPREFRSAQPADYLGRI